MWSTSGCICCRLLDVLNSMMKKKKIIFKAIIGLRVSILLFYHHAYTHQMHTTITVTLKEEEENNNNNSEAIIQLACIYSTLFYHHTHINCIRLLSHWKKKKKQSRKMIRKEACFFAACSFTGNDAGLFKNESMCLLTSLVSKTTDMHHEERA